MHHSDRGVQYAAPDYTRMLEQHQATISLSRKGNPFHNSACESFMKTLKYEEVYRNQSAILKQHAPASANFWRISITTNACTRRSATCHRHSEQNGGAARQQENKLKFVGGLLTQGVRDIRRVLRTYRNSPDGTFSVTQTGNWLHRYQRSANNWRPIANRFLPVIWPNTVRFLPASANCLR